MAPAKGSIPPETAPGDPVALRCPKCHERYRCADEGGTPRTLCPRDGTRLEPDPLCEHLIGGRRIVDYIGGGAQAAVFKAHVPPPARHDALKARYEAMKILLGAADPRALRRFEEEAAILSGLRNPHTIRVHDFGTEQVLGGLPYLVMELAEGVTLNELYASQAQGKLPWSRVVRIGLGLASALTEAHHDEVVHRDIKPTNIMVATTDEGDDFPRLVDFGMALSAEGTRTVKGRAMLGTPGYFAPEQWPLPPRVVGPPADLYALGVVLLETLLGYNPYGYSQPEDVAQDELCLVAWHEARCGMTPPIPGGIPAELHTLLEGLLAVDPERRPTALETRTRLRALLDTALLGPYLNQLESERAELTRRVAEFKARERSLNLKSHGWLRAAAVGAMALGLGLLVGFFLRGESSTPELAGAPSGPRVANGRQALPAEPSRPEPVVPPAHDAAPRSIPEDAAPQPPPVDAALPPSDAAATSVWLRVPGMPAVLETTEVKGLGLRLEGELRTTSLGPAGETEWQLGSRHVLLRCNGNLLLGPDDLKNCVDEAKKEKKVGVPEVKIEYLTPKGLPGEVQLEVFL